MTTTSSTRRTTLVLVLAAGLAGGWLTTAGATPPSTGPLAPVPSDAASGTLAETRDGRPAKIDQDGVQLKTKDITTVTTFDLTYPPGSFSGWHSHPGIVVVVVKQGSVVRQTGCTTETFTAGQAFTEVGPHHVSNPGADPAVLSITRIFPAEEVVGRHDEPAPVCTS